jgi:uncharacterized protein YecT (DUF1311 family)
MSIRYNYLEELVQMTKRRLQLAALCVSCLALPAVTHAGKPTFDCAKAQGEVETLICADAALAALDHRLAETYSAAAAKATVALAKSLRQDQRGWISGRNDCWKASEKTWITATWTVSSVRDCVDAQYRLRISELQALWRLLPPETASYACNGNPANEVVASFFASDPPTVRLERGDHTATLWRVPLGAESRYEGHNVSLVRNGSSVAVAWLSVGSDDIEELQCSAR